MKKAPIGALVYRSDDPLKQEGVVLARTAEDFVLQYKDRREILLDDVKVEYVPGNLSNPAMWDEVANDYELIVKDELFEYAEAMRKDGYDSLFPIITDAETGLVVDGRNRALMANLAGVEPIIVTRHFESLREKERFVDQANQNRRQQTPAQKAAKAVRRLDRHQVQAKKNQQLGKGLPNEKRGRIKISDHGRARDKAGLEAGVSGIYVTKAKKIQDVSPEMFERLQRGEVTIPEAERLLDFKIAEPKENATDVEIKSELSIAGLNYTRLAKEFSLSQLEDASQVKKSVVRLDGGSDLTIIHKLSAQRKVTLVILRGGDFLLYFGEQQLTKFIKAGRKYGTVWTYLGVTKGETK